MAEIYMESKSQFFTINQNASKTITEFVDFMTDRNMVFAETSLQMTHQRNFVLFHDNEVEDGSASDTHKFGDTTWQLVTVDEPNSIAQLYIPAQNPLVKLATNIFHADDDELSKLLENQYDVIWKISFRWLDEKQVSIAMYEIVTQKIISRNQIILQQIIDKFLESLRSKNLVTIIHRENIDLVTDWQFLSISEPNSKRGKKFADNISNVYEVVNATQRFWKDKYHDDVFVQIADVASAIDNNDNDQRVCIITVGNSIGTWLRECDTIDNDACTIYEYWFKTENGIRTKFVLKRYFNSSHPQYRHLAESLDTEFLQFLEDNDILLNRGKYHTKDTKKGRYKKLLKLRQESLHNGLITAGWVATCKDSGLNPWRVKKQFPDLKPEWDNANYLPTIDELLAEDPLI